MAKGETHYLTRCRTFAPIFTAVWAIGVAMGHLTTRLLLRADRFFGRWLAFGFIFNSVGVKIGGIFMYTGF